MTITNLKRISTAIATGAVLLSSIAPAAFAAETVSGNGAFSDNTVTVNNNSTTSVGQNNVANVSNSVSSNATTGGNSAGFNTGGNTTVNTGDATNLVNVSNQLNTNQAAVSNCSCQAGNTDISLTGNGAFSTNNGSVNNNNTTTLSQNNQANVTNAVSANSSTGSNDAGFNTGGNTTIKTGNAGVGVTIDTMANSNVALVGGGAVAGAGNGSSITINGNGAFSENSAAINKNSAIVLGQNNDAAIVNAVDAAAHTGDNSTGFNTGGTETVWTGNATTLVGIDNAVNFNAASVDCGCILGGTTLKIAGDGAYSGSDVTANDTSVLAVGAVNDAALYNAVAHDATTGTNDAGFNTASVLGGDPLVKTGNAYSSTDLSNSGNENVFTQGATLGLPGNWNMSLQFDLMGLWSGMMGMVH